MDIAKIRKKAKEKEAAGPSPEAGPEPQAAGQPAEPAPEELSAPAEAVDTEAGEEAAGEEPAGGGEGGAGSAGAPPAAARPPAGEEQAEEIIELLTFTLAQEEFAFRVPEVEEIIRYQKITRVPTMPGYVCGITSLRGKIIPVIDLKARLILRGGCAAGAPETAEPEEKVETTETGETAEAGQKAGKILILAGPQGLIGATIGRVLGVVRFPRERIFEPPSHLSEEELQYIEGVVTVDKRFISIIRAEAALTIDVL